MRKHALLCLCLLLVGLWTNHAQAQDLLARINGLRAQLGLAAYSSNGALASAAQAHAQWMVETGQISHTQNDGSTPRSRAAAAGYGSSWVSENIYMGSGPASDAAWNFWINSPIHYAGLTSPNYDEIGVGSASGTHGTAFVLVFGASGAPRVRSGGDSGAGGGGGASSAPRSFVVGVDGSGNIMHEVQPGETLGDIALTYGYTWGDIPAMLSINGLTQDDIRRILPGSVFLVPPKGGTFTPQPSPTLDPALIPTETPTPPPSATPTPTETLEPLPQPAMFNSAITPTPQPSPTLDLSQITPTRAMVVRALPTQVAALSTPAPLSGPPGTSGTDGPPLWLWALVALQLAILGGAVLELWRRRGR